MHLGEMPKPSGPIEGQQDATPDLKAAVTMVDPRMVIYPSFSFSFFFFSFFSSKYIANLTKNPVIALLSTLLRLDALKFAKLKSAKCLILSGCSEV